MALVGLRDVHKVSAREMSNRGLSFRDMKRKRKEMEGKGGERKGIRKGKN